MPGKRPSFTLPVEPISPPPKPAVPLKRALVEAPGTAPGSEELISTPFIAIAAQSGRPNISLVMLFSKWNGCSIDNLPASSAAGKPAKARRGNADSPER